MGRPPPAPRGDGAGDDAKRLKCDLYTAPALRLSAWRRIGTESGIGTLKVWPPAKSASPARLRDAHPARMAKNKTAKGKGSTVRRTEKRKKKFTPETPGKGAKANVLRDDDAPPASKKRSREGADTGEAAPPRKTYKQGPFSRPAAAPAADDSPALPLSRKEQRQVAVRRPNYTFIQVRHRALVGKTTAREGCRCQQCSVPYGVNVD